MRRRFTRKKLKRRYLENVSNSDRAMVDDGPGGFWGDSRAYQNYATDSARRLNMNVVKFHGQSEYMNDISSTIYPNGSGQYPVSWFPSGVDGDGEVAYNYNNMKNTPYYKKWKRHTSRLSNTYNDDMQFHSDEIKTSRYGKLSGRSNSMRRQPKMTTMLGESVFTENTKKRFDVDFYKGSGHRQTSHEEIIRGSKFSDVVSQATKIAKSKGLGYVEFYYKDSYIGFIDKRKAYQFKKGSDWHNSPLSLDK